jgi:MerR family transcriptional regulator, copper efflux regulator
VYIGELAKRTRATPKAIRLYESLGLLGAISRRGVYRVYLDKHVTQVRLIKQAQAMGFKLAEVAPALQGRRLEPNWALLAEQVDTRRADIAQEIVRLREVDRQLQAINVEIRACAESI